MYYKIQNQLKKTTFVIDHNDKSKEKKTPKNGANITVENDTLHLMWIDLNRNFSIISKNLFIGLLSIYRYSKEGISKIHILLHAWNSPLARVLLAFRIFLHQIFFRINIFGFFSNKI